MPSESKVPGWAKLKPLLQIRLYLQLIMAHLTTSSHMQQVLSLQSFIVMDEDNFRKVVVK
jgi:hypothetical protein